MIPRTAAQANHRLLIAAMVLLALAGCAGGGPDLEPTALPTPTTEDPSEPTERAPDLRGGAPLTIDLQLENLSPLYKGFFSHQPFVEQLATDLAPHIKSRSATVKVIWSESESIGAIHLLVPDGEAPLAAAGRRLTDDRWLEAAPLEPYVAALGAYRDAQGERYDLRILSFSLALEVWDPHSESRCLWPIVRGAQEQLVLDATLTCRDPFGESTELERDGDRWPARVKGSKKARKALAGALEG